MKSPGREGFEIVWSSCLFFFFFSFWGPVPLFWLVPRRCAPCPLWHIICSGLSQSKGTRRQKKKKNKNQKQKRKGRRDWNGRLDLKQNNIAMPKPPATQQITKTFQAASAEIRKSQSVVALTLAGAVRQEQEQGRRGAAAAVERSHTRKDRSEWRGSKRMEGESGGRIGRSRGLKTTRSEKMFLAAQVGCTEGREVGGCGKGECENKTYHCSQ